MLKIPVNSLGSSQEAFTMLDMGSCAGFFSLQDGEKTRWTNGGPWKMWISPGKLGKIGHQNGELSLENRTWAAKHSWFNFRKLFFQPQNSRLNWFNDAKVWLNMLVVILNIACHPDGVYWVTQLWTKKSSGFSFGSSRWTGRLCQPFDSSWPLVRRQSCQR